MKTYSVAIVDKMVNKTQYEKHFPSLAAVADIEVHHLSSTRVSRLLKKDIDIHETGFDPALFDLTILIGAEALKEFTKRTGVRDYTGRVVCTDEHGAVYSTCVSPASLAFQPANKPVVAQADKDFVKLLEFGKDTDDAEYVYSEEDPDDFANYLRKIIKDPKVDCVALDTETSGFNPYTDELLGISVSHKERYGRYHGMLSITEEVEELLQELINKKPVVLHHAKFDMQFLARQCGIDWSNAREVHDSMIMHYVLDERKGHGLKQLALRYTTMGDYDADLDVFKTEFMAAHKITKDQFSYAFIPFDILGLYGAKDTDATLRLFNLFKDPLKKNQKLWQAYKFLMRGNYALYRMQMNGVPVSSDRIQAALSYADNELQRLSDKVYASPAVAELEARQEAKFNPNSVVQLRKLFYDVLNLPPVQKYTDSGQFSTDAEVLGILAQECKEAATILEYRKLLKIRNTYLANMASNIDPDGRLRSNFNLTTTTSGRLSSSGTLNLQNLPRDDGLVKGCIKAREGYSIVAWDMQTAEVYIAAVMSGDKALMNVFLQDGNFHSNMAHRVFNLPCDPSEVADLFPHLRQAAKAVTFGILYGSGPQTVVEAVMKDMPEGQVFTITDAKQAIKDYFAAFPRLKKWIEESHASIKKNGFIYTPYGRKRRLHDIGSKDRSVVAGELRSGFNAIIQGTSSDVLLEGLCDLMDEIDRLEFPAKVIAVVHDSVVSEVRNDVIEQFNEMLCRAIQKDRNNGLTIPGRPMGLDCDGIAPDYSLGKIEKQYPEVALVA